MCRCSARFADGEAHCPACCRTFSSVEDFDAHRSGIPTNRYCLHPEKAGLVAESRPHALVWTTPKGSTR